MKSADKLQIAHDLIGFVLASPEKFTMPLAGGEPGQTTPLFDKSDLLYWMAVADTLCYVLEHSHNPSVMEALFKLADVAKRAGWRGTLAEGQRLDHTNTKESA